MGALTDGTDIKEADPPSLWRSTQFRSYLASTAFSGTAFSMQQLLVSWMLVGILLLPADTVGIVQAVIGIPGLFLMLLGGASADRSDPRSLLIKVYAVAWLIPFALALTIWNDLLNLWSVMLFGLAMSTVMSFSSPAQQSILNRIAGRELQKGVTAATAVGFIVQIVGLTLAGQMERVGLMNVLLVQGSCLLMGAFAVHRIAAMESRWVETGQATWEVVLEGLKATFRSRVIFQTLLINFISSIFNAGAFMTVLPFIIKRVYEGNALGLAFVMMLFFAGAAISNLMMLRLMPFERPGRLFLAMQLSRVVIVMFLWFSPPWWLLLIVLFAWGLNMGVTSTLARTIVQESAEPEYLGRIMSVFSLGMLGSAPIGAIVLGFIIEAFGTLNALIPAMFVSTFLFLFGVFATRVWRYRSPKAVAP
ncbi:MAG: MFS transporter [Pseudomonadales bacterium]|nr:MFS transporter [Pseudomonadales bacterium]